LTSEEIFSFEYPSPALDESGKEERRVSLEVTVGETQAD